jgi:hypothetical protein
MKSNKEQKQKRNLPSPPRSTPKGVQGEETRRQTQLEPQPEPHKQPATHDKYKQPIKKLLTKNTRIRKKKETYHVLSLSGGGRRKHGRKRGRSRSMQSRMSMRRQSKQLENKSRYAKEG